MRVDIPKEHYIYIYKNLLLTFLINNFKSHYLKKLILIIINDLEKMYLIVSYEQNNALYSVIRRNNEIILLRSMSGKCTRPKQYVCNYYYL